MTSSQTPKEYLTLPTGEKENFSEFYDQRLLKPKLCPDGSLGRDDCECTIDSSVKGGLTVFSRVRINVTSMRIDTEDMTFARQIHGTRVAYGEAGDCYSSLDCPQGRFSVNLKGTGLRVHSSMEWEGRGSGAAVHVSRKDDGGGKVWWLLWSLPPSRSTMDSARHNAKRWRWPLLTTNNCQTCVFSQGRQEDVAQPLNALKPLSSCMNVMEQRTPLERWQSER